MQLTKSRHGGLLEGQAPPRIRHAPVVRANAWEDVADLSAQFGVVLDEWQENVLEAAMGERADGTWAARQIGLSTPRQNGKSQLIVARALAGVLLFDEQTIIISAHQQDTAREVFGRMIDLIEQHSTLERRVSSVMRAINRESITFTSGQSIRFKARSTGGGRGFSCDCLLLDEAQILGASAWSAILPTMSARPNPQAWLLGTPPTENDDGEVFGRIRQAGLDGKESRVAYLEWSASQDDPIDDPTTWAKANPSYGTRITFDAVASERATMSDGQFCMERLGMWEGDGGLVVNFTKWSSLVGVRPEGRATAFGVACHNGQFSVVACWVDGELVHVEEVFAHFRLDLVAEYLRKSAGRRRSIMVDESGSATALVPMLKADRMDVVGGSVRDTARGCELMSSRVDAGSVTHTGQESLNTALASARRKPYRDSGAWIFDLKVDSTIAPAMALALALTAASGSKPKRTSSRREAISL